MKREGRMKRLFAWVAPGNGWDRRGRAPFAEQVKNATPEQVKNATPVQVSTGARVILSQWAWCAYQRARIAPGLLVATGEVAND
jgi:hypothetical protein